MSIEINGGEDFLAGRPANKAATGGPAQAGTAPKLASQKQLLAMQAQQKALLARSAKARQLRARFDDRSTDKTYRSADVSAIGEQTVADTLEGMAGEPMDVLVNGTLIAQGEVVVVNDKFGIRLTDVISQIERIKKLK